MRVVRLSFLIAMLLAGSASAEHPALQAHVRYLSCNERAVQAAAQEPYLAYMLVSAIPSQCRAEEETLKALLPALIVEDLRTWLQPNNEQAIERIRRERRDGIMLIAPRSTIER